MNLDEVMAVWRSQRAAPRHRVNEVLLRRTLKQGEAKLLAERRWERWREYCASAVGFGVFAVFLAAMIDRYDRKLLTGWDLVLPILGMAVTVLTARAMFVRHRAQALREQNFGDSLRDQINRQIAQLDFWATRVRRTKVWSETLLVVNVYAILVFAWWRVNDRAFSFSAAKLIPIAVGLCASIAWLAVSFWRSRRRLQREVLPRRRRLEALLKELDEQQ
jgi:hypothetical protein